MGNTINEKLLDTIDNFLKGNLSEEEHKAFEKQMENNKELEEIVVMQKNLFEIHDFSTINKSQNNYSKEELFKYRDQIRNKDNQELFAKIKNIGENHLKKKTSTKKYFFKYYIAASIAIIFGTILIVNRDSPLENYYQANVNWEELPSYIDKGQTENYFTKGEIAFKNKEFKKAIDYFEKITSENELYAYSLLYIGAAYEQLNNNKQALAAFDQVSKLKSFEEHSRAYWYKFLIYLKLDNKEQALIMQSIILSSENNYNYSKASKIKL